MIQQTAEEAIERLTEFRQKLYESFGILPDATMELLDSLSSNEHASSPVELSENSLFQRSHGSVYQAIRGCYGSNEEERAKILSAQRIALGSVLPLPSLRSHVVFVIDVTPCFRPDGETVSDRGWIYKGGGQVEAGHNYSILGYVPELPQPHSWCVPLSIERVPFSENKEQFGIEQAIVWASDKNLPFHKQLVVLLGDRAYISKQCLHRVWQQKNLVIVTRFRNNQVVYQQPEPKDEGEKEKGHPRWFGDPFRLNGSETWTEPSETYSFEQLNKRGQTERVEVKAWSNLLMRGKRKPEVIPMHERPFTLVQVTTYRANGNKKFKNPLWLTAFGQRQDELSAKEIVDDYFERPNIEHFNRFGKQDLLLTAFSTSNTFHEENWAHLVGLSYAQLFLAQPLCTILPKPWQKHLPQFKYDHIPFTPAMVQQDFARIIQQIGTPAKAPKPRGNSPGRPQGSTKPPRPRKKVLRKSKKKKKQKK